MKKLILTVAIFAASVTMFGQVEKAISYESELHFIMVDFVCTCEDVEFDKWNDLISHDRAVWLICVASEKLEDNIARLNKKYKIKKK
jgi:hypothetical protein|tara:strand:- start:576 stop:836 length:261 start_codon:yes stop_codon:yes gene_type:complete